MSTDNKKQSANLCSRPYKTKARRTGPVRLGVWIRQNGGYRFSRGRNPTRLYTLDRVFPAR